MKDRTGHAVGSQAPAVDRVEAVDALLPQTQCRKCGFDGCRPYAIAMATGTAAINRCPPGGAAGIARLAALLQAPALPLDPSCGEETPARLALIDEQACIGCTLCIQACPVDAIAGAPRRMHTVLMAHCTGCERCLPPCPVDCIALIEISELAEQGVPGALARMALAPDAARDRSRARHHVHIRQQIRLKARNEERLARKAGHKLEALQGSDDDTRRKRETVMRALARARLRREGLPDA